MNAMIHQGSYDKPKMIAKKMAYWKKGNKKKMMRKDWKVLRYWKLEMTVLSMMLTEKKMKSLRLEKNWT